MANAFSRLHNAIETWSFRYNCYEAVHPWTPHCTDSALEIGLTVFAQAIKLYTPLYLFSQLMKRRYDYESFKNTAQSILRSTTFISANAFFALLFFCSTGYITGKFYYYAVAYLPAFLGSSMAVLIEKPSRRSSLAFYVANVASDALFRIYVARGYVRPIRNGQVYMFTFAIATLMWLAKKHGFEDDPLSSAIRLIVGGEEATPRCRRKGYKVEEECLMLELEGLGKLDDDNNNETNFKLENNNSEDYYYSDLNIKDKSNLYFKLNNNNNNNKCNVSFKEKCENIVKFLIYSKHSLCPHRNNCFIYTLKASTRALLIGSLAQISLKLVPKLTNILMNKNENNDSDLVSITRAFQAILFDYNSYKMGLFLSTFSGLFKLTNCLLRWSSDSNKPINCFISGLAAGPALILFPSPTIATYVLWKCLEALFNEAVRRDIIKNKNLFIIILYGLATSQLFYSALMDPRYMKKSYMAFLDRMSEHKMHMINRSVLDIFGTQASAGYEEFFPDLHPKYMSRAFLGSIWIWMIEQKNVVAIASSSK